MIAFLEYIALIGDKGEKFFILKKMFNLKLFELFCVEDII